MWNSSTARTKKVIEETVTINLLYLHRTLSTSDLETIRIERLCFHCDYKDEYWYDGLQGTPFTGHRYIAAATQQCDNSSNLDQH
jgi:hypothetical protein